MKLMEKIENMFAAAALAEEGEFDTARRMADEGSASAGKGTSGKCVCEHCGDNMQTAKA